MENKIEVTDKEPGTYKSVEVTGLAKKLADAFKAGPVEIRKFLDSEEGKSEEVRSLLKNPQVDGISKDDVIQINDAPDTSVANLIPTQRFIDLMQSVSFPLSSANAWKDDKGNSVDGLNDAITKKKGFGTIIISPSKEGTLIIDGHHRWSGIFGIAGKEGKINAKSVNWPGVDAKEKLAAAQLAIAAYKGTGKETPSKGGEAKFNILGKSAAEITKLIMDNVNVAESVDPKVKSKGGLLNDQMIKDILEKPEIIFTWAGIKEGEKDTNKIRQAIATKVGQNLSEMKNFVEGAPPREDMPQFDDELPNPGPKFKTIEEPLKKGEYNISPPFAKGQETVKESRVIKTFEKFMTKWKKGEI